MTMRNVTICCLIFAFVYLTRAERDFNFNDMQIPLLEPKDNQPIIVPRSYEHPYAAEQLRCTYLENEILLSLVLKHHEWRDLSDKQRAKVLEKLSQFFAIPKEFIILETVTKRDLNEMYEESIRKGNNKCQGNNRRMGRVNLMIGCGGSYFTMGTPIANQIGHQMKDGTIDNITGEKFGCWAIWRKQSKKRADRNRRQVEGSGENFEYDDDYDYGDELPRENETELPINNTSSSNTTTSTTSTTTSTVVPTPTHAHRHHHGDQDEETTTLANEQLINISTTVTPPKLEITSSSILNSAQLNATTPTSLITDYVEVLPENAPPMIKTRLQKFAVTSGKLFTYIVPAETFIDPEDKTNLRLQMSNKDGEELSTNSWLQFNTETHEIIGLPLDDSVSRWQYRLTATDSGNESVTEILEMTVQQHRGVRSVNHEINIVVQRQDGALRNIDWQIKLVKAIATVLGENRTDAIVVREVRQFPTGDANTATFVYFNETLPTSKCPENELTAIIKALQVAQLQELVLPTLKIKQVSGQLIGACQKQLPAVRPKPTSTVVKNAPPQPRNQVDRVNATFGHLLVYKVPSDTFYDDHELKLTLRTKDNRELSPRNWLQFDSKNQEFYGVPKSLDIGTEEYLLVAENSLGLSANDALVVVVSNAPKRDYIVFFKAYLGIRHEQFNADLQRKFVERIASLFGDAGTQYIQIRSITTQHDADSTIVNFYNTTLYKTHQRCPESQVDAARSVYLMPDNSVRERVKKILGAELNLTNLQLHNIGSCNGQTDIGQREYPTAKAEVPTQSAFGENYMITIVYPAVIIVTMILVAILIACCIHKRRRKSGKMELGDEEERKSFRTKGIPVIFQDELDEKPEIGNKSPIIMKDEKPPLLPPSYNTSNMNGDNDVDEYVPPPAVIVGGREVRGKSPATPSYRKPPPYVSP